MIKHGANDAATYGQLLEWDDHEDAFVWLATRKQFQPGEGLAILEVQERLLNFLVECCRSLLHNIPTDKLTSDDAYPILPEPHVKTDRETNGFNSLLAMKSEAPYRVPAKLDLARIESVLEARRSAAEDHLWTLREDPAYFHEVLLENKEHRQEMILDSCGDKHPVFHPLRQEIFWARLAGCVSVDAFIPLEVFSELHSQARALRAIHTKHAKSISITKDLPADLLAAILKFQHYLLQAAKGYQDQLKKQVFASPPWRKHFFREPPPDEVTSIIHVSSKPSMKLNDVERRLMWLFRTLWEDGFDLKCIGLPLLVDELGRLVEKDPSASELLSAQIASAVGDLSIIAQCLGQLDSYLPWARGFAHNLVDQGKGIEKEYDTRASLWDTIPTSFSDRNMKLSRRNPGTLVNPAGGKFAYPVEKKRTKENVEALRQAEKNLDEVWSAVDRIVYAKCGSLQGTAIHRLLSQPHRTLQRTPEWVDPPSSGAKQTREPVLDPSLASLYKPLSTIYIGELGPASSAPKVSSTQSKTKTKTRAHASSNDAVEEEPTPAVTLDLQQPEIPSIPVDALALKVFRTIFFNPAVTSSPGEVSWTDFLHAMTSTGLFAAEKLYGSVWQFTNLDGLRIQFHEPHPKAKMPFTTARRFGRRLNRSFGWEGSCFVLKGK